jgi:Arabinose efflux permease
MNHKFSGYKMAFCAAVNFFAVIGLGYITLSLYLPVLAKDMHISVGLVSVMFGVMSGCSMLASFISGSVIGKIGLKKVIMIGVLNVVAGYLVLFAANNIVTVFIGAGMAGIGFSWSGAICMGNIVPNWFIEKQGAVMGMVVASCGIGGFIGSPVVSWLISNYGWRTACLITAVALALLMIPATLVIKAKPSDIGQVPLGYKANSTAVIDEVSGISFKQAKNSAVFWLLILMIITFALFVNGMNAHVASFITTQKYTIIFAGMMLSIVSIFNMLGNVIMGAINDKAGTKACVIWGAMIGLTSLGLMLVSNYQFAAIGFAVCFGLFNPVCGTLIPLLVFSTFGQKAFAEILGVFNGAIGLAGIIAPIGIGMLVTATGSYRIGIWILMITTTIGFIAGLAGMSKKTIEL